MKKKLIRIISLLFFGFVVVISICEWTKHRGESLESFCFLVNTPEDNAAYENRGGLEVLQVLSGGVLVKLNGEAFSSNLPHYGRNDPPPSYGLLYIETHYPYADKESLKRGYYEFAGNYTFKTIEGDYRTVRKFREHHCKLVRLDEILPCGIL